MVAKFVLGLHEVPYTQNLDKYLHWSPAFHLNSVPLYFILKQYCVYLQMCIYT
jgi:hypothetical protein